MSRIKVVSAFVSGDSIGVIDDKGRLWLGKLSRKKPTEWVLAVDLPDEPTSEGEEEP